MAFKLKIKKGYKIGFFNRIRLLQTNTMLRIMEFMYMHSEVVRKSYEEHDWEREPLEEFVEYLKQKWDKENRIKITGMEYHIDKVVVDEIKRKSKKDNGS